jgi:hypothetical protein
MTDVGSAVGPAGGTVVTGVGAGVTVVVGTCVVGAVTGGEAGTGVIADGTVFVATAVSAVPVAGTGFIPGSGVPGGTGWEEIRSPAPPAGPANGVTVIGIMCGTRTYAAAPRKRIPAMTNTQTGRPVPAAGPDTGLPGIEAGAAFGSIAPQEVQNFCAGNSSAVPHFEQNLRAIIV